MNKRWFMIYRTMKRALLFYAVILLIGFDINCQTEQSGLPDSTILAGPGERIRLFTDRTLYCVNERIFFTAAYSCSVADSFLWSKVLYVELIKWNGVKLANLKLKLDKSGSSASLQIPGDLISGNYYLRAYTKWMRNFSINDYAYRLIKIVNPYNAETDAGPAEVPDSGKSMINRRPSKEILQGIHGSMNKSQYQTREKAEVELDINDDKSTVCHDFCISIVKVGSIDTSTFFIKPELETSAIKWGDIEYLPEIRGITISGNIIDKAANTPKKNLLVQLSEPSNGEFFSVYQTRDKGQFIFSLPNLYGKYDLFIGSEASDTGVSKISIDNGFCNRPVLLPYVAFSLNKDEKHLVRDMIVTMQLNEKFLPHPDTAIKLQVNRHQPVPFYGSRKHYFTKKYIELPNIEEFFIEIIPEASVVYNKGKTELKISGNTGFSNYPPLILLDNIPIDNDDRLLKIPLNKIERVEVIESGYVVGKMKYSGLVSIYSKDKDFAGIELNKNSMFFAFDLFSEENSGFPVSGNLNDSRVPDRRNLLYWNPDIQLSASKKTTISFYTSDNKGDYVVYIFGKNNGDVREVYGKCFFSVN
jgi:hypothetical protein